MEQEEYDINTIDALDFNTPRSKKHNSISRQSINVINRIKSNKDLAHYSPNSIPYSRNPSSLIVDKTIPQANNRDIKSTTFNVSPIQQIRPSVNRQSTQDIIQNLKDLGPDKISLNASFQLNNPKQPQTQFSFSRENYDQAKQNEYNSSQPEEGQTELRQHPLQKSMSPLGIPFQPFHHTKSGFKSKSHLNEAQELSQNQLNHNTSYDDQNRFRSYDLRSDSNLRNRSCFVERDDDEDVIRRYDKKIIDISDTLKQIQSYKNNLHNMQLVQKKRAKSHHAQSAKTDNIGKLPAIKQPNMYFAPMDEPSPKNQKKLKKAKKQKQQGMQALAKQILNNLPQEKLANLMAINMYNQALMKKETNQEKITSVIGEQNKLLIKMLDQYEKKQIDTKRQIRINLSKVEGDKSNNDVHKFERDKRNFERAYSNIQQKFTKELHLLPLSQTIQQNTTEDYVNQPLLTEGDLPDQIRKTKHLKRIHTHSQKYKQFTPTKINQPPMLF